MEHNVVISTVIGSRFFWDDTSVTLSIKKLRKVELLYEKSGNDLIKYRIQRSDATFKEVKALAEIDQWNGLVNRLYYLAFYSGSALLLKKNIYTKTQVV